MASNVRLQVSILADGRTVVRAFDETANASERTSKQIKGDSEKNEESMAKVEVASERVRGAVASLAGTAGFAGLAFGLKDVVQAGQRWQVQQAQLVNALKSTGQYSKSTVASITDATEKLSRSGGYAVPQQLTGINQLIRLTHSASAAMRDNKIATDLARSGATTFSNAQTVIERALSGSTRGLQKYIGVIEPVKTAEFQLTQAHGFNLDAMQAQSKALGKLGPMWLKHEETLHNITPAAMEHAQALDKQATALQSISRLQAKYAGSTSAYGHTAAGAISNAENSLDIAIEKIGKSFLPIVAKLGQAFANVAGTISDHWGQITRVIGQVTKPLGAVTRGIVDLFEHSKTARGALVAVAAGLAVVGVRAKAAALYGAWFTAAEGESTAATLALDTALDALPFFAITAGVVLLYEHFSMFRRIIQSIPGAVSSAFNWVKGAVNSVVQFIGQHWRMLAVGGAFALGGPFLALPVYVATHFDQVKRLATTVVRDLGRAFDKVFNAITWPFRQAWKFISGIFTDIKRGAQSIGGGITNTLGITGHGGLLHGFGLFHTGGIARRNDPARPMRQGSIARFHAGGTVRLATGGLLGGYGGGDQIPAYLEAGEGVLRKEAVQAIGVQNFNMLNATGTLPPAPASASEVPLVVYLTTTLSGRVVADEVVKTSAKRGALTGAYVSG